MEKVKRVTKDMKTRAMLTREEAILKRMREAKGVDDSKIDLTLVPGRAKHDGSDAIIDARYEDIEKMFRDDTYRPSTTTDSKVSTTTTKEKADKAKVEETRRMKEAYMNPDYLTASQKAREARQKMISLLEDKGISVDESVEF